MWRGGEMHSAWSPTLWLSADRLSGSAAASSASITILMSECRQVHLGLKRCFGDTAQAFCIWVCSLSDYLWREPSPFEPTRSEPTHFATVSPLAVSQVYLSPRPLWSNTLWQLLEDISTQNRLSVLELSTVMSKGGYPSVFMVDTHATRPPVPPRLSQGRRRPGAAQTLLIMLVCVALCGLAIEACFIYRLYHLEPVSINHISESTPAYSACDFLSTLCQSASCLIHFFLNLTFFIRTHSVATPYSHFQFSFLLFSFFLCHPQSKTLSVVFSSITPFI